MSLKQFVMQKLTLFFTLTTLITAAVYLVGTAFDPGARLGYGDLLTPLRYAALCVIPTFVTYAGRELTAREMLLRKGLEFVLIEAVILTLAFQSPAIDTGRGAVVLAIAGSVLAVYGLANLISWCRDLSEAKKMNDDLARFRRLHNGCGEEN